MPEPSLREALDTAVADHEAAVSIPETGTPAAPAAPAVPATPASVEPGQAPAQTPQEGEQALKASGIEPAPKPGETIDPLAEAPKSWKAANRTHWGVIPKEAREEIVRRDKEVFRILGESGQARKLQAELTDIVRPYEARIRSSGQTPLQVINNLLEFDYALSNAPPTRRAMLAAKLIGDYGIDIRELDAALSGSAPADPVQATVDRLLAERLAPFQQFMQTQQSMEHQRNQSFSNEATHTVESMATDVTKYPHFETVREDMADLVEIGAKRGVYFSADQAYNRAVAMNPDLGAHVVAQRQQEAQRQTALSQNERAQKALLASSSVSGAPLGTPGSGGSAADLRSAVESAFNSVTSR
jgi:hypothetical protein